MEPFADDQEPQEDEPSGSGARDRGVVTGPAPYDAAEDEDFEDD
jgi:hypothetical protein